MTELGSSNKSGNPSICFKSQAPRLHRCQIRTERTFHFCSVGELMVKRYWCKLTHKRTTWPIHGHYICLQCGSEFPVLWDKVQERTPMMANLEPGQPLTLQRSAFEPSRTRS